jgi:hypothetical protein
MKAPTASTNMTEVATPSVACTVFAQRASVLSRSVL